MKLLGTNATLYKFLSNEQQYEINVELPGEDSARILFDSERKYIIPEYQREIRWEEENIELLIEDLASGPKYLGNIIITKNGIDYELIDGQQRITTLIMILKAIKEKHENEIDIIKCCKLVINSFEKFDYILEQNFPEHLKNDEEVIKTDRLHQIDKYYELWKFINEQDDILDKSKAGKLIENIKQSEMNIIVNHSDDLKASIQYFLDVNVKGIKLDTEDIFKSYLFKNDERDEIREAWYELKTSVVQLEKEGIKYPLLDLLRHYLICQLHKKSEFDGLEFDTDFKIGEAFKCKDGAEKVFRKGSHIIEIINDKSFMLSSIKETNNVVKCMLNSVRNSSDSQTIKSFFKVKNGQLDSLEIDIIHNLMNKVLKDKLVLPKSLLMKYIIHVYKGQKEKTAYRKIYGVYLSAVLFTIFANRKSEDVLISILRADNSVWYDRLIEQVKTYFEINNISQAKLFKKFTMIRNEDEEDYKFRCRSLAAIYNYFSIKNNKVEISDLKSFYAFLNDSFNYSTEHLIVSENKKKKTVIELEGIKTDYYYEGRFYNKMVKSLFNFIFISDTLNNQLSNMWLPSKMLLLKTESIECNYSKLVIKNVEKLSDAMIRRISQEPDTINAMDAFLKNDFDDLYVDYSREILKKVFSKLKGEEE